MKILLVNDDLNPGGVQTLVCRVANELSRKGHAVGVAASAGGSLWGNLDAAVRRHYAPPMRGLRGLFFYSIWLARLVRREDYDLVHAHQRKISVLARLASGGSRSVVEHVHNTFRPRPWDFLSFKGPALIACSDSVRKMLIDDFACDPERVSLISNFVPVRPGPLEPLVTEVGPLRVLVPARLSEQKNPLLLIEASRFLSERSVPVLIRWAGDGELGKKCTDRVKELQVGGVISLIGYQSRLESQYDWCDVVMLVSRWEGLPLALLEGAARGKVLVAPDVGGCKEVVRDGDNGILLPEDSSPGEVAQALEGLALDRGYLSRLQKSSRRAVASISERDLAGEILAVYERVL